MLQYGLTQSAEEMMLKHDLTQAAEEVLKPSVDILSQQRRSLTVDLLSQQRKCSSEDLLSRGGFKDAPLQPIEEVLEHGLTQAAEDVLKRGLAQLRMCSVRTHSVS